MPTEALDSEKNAMTFTQNQYPAVFLAADQASAAAQQRYLHLTMGTLTLLVLGAGFAAAAPISALSTAKPALSISSALSLATSLMVTLYLKTQKPEQLWYGGRAVAESAKSMAWRYMTRAAPYEANIPDAELDRRFISTLESIMKERKQLAFGFGGEFDEQPQISDRMREARQSELPMRRQLYLGDRIQNQRKWYGRQAKTNREAETRYSYAVLGTQLAAVLAAVALIAWPGSEIRLTALFASTASSLIAWVQLKQHKELAQSYSIAELELGFIEDRARYLNTEEELSNFVSDAENAISREHTLWIARRDRT
jgi:hypothetical protein